MWRCAVQASKLPTMLIACANPKGGVGKSTIATHLVGGMIAQNPDTETVLVDCDPQRSASRWVGEACEGLVRIENAQDVDELLDLLGELEDAEANVVVDVAGTASDTHRAAMLHVDTVVLPTGCGVLDLRALGDASRLVLQARKIRRDDNPRAVVVLNRFQSRLRLASEARAAIEAMGLPVAETTLGMRTGFADAAGQGCLVWDLAGADQAGVEMQELVKELLNGN